MENNLVNERRRAATMARAYVEGKVTWKAFMDEFGEYDGNDNLIDELVDLIEHEPQRGGLWGLNEKQWSEYQNSIQSIINELECGHDDLE